MNAWTIAHIASTLTEARPTAWMLVLLLGVGGLSPLYAQESEQYVYHDMPLRTVITAIESASGYHFLYRDALVSGKRISLQAPRANLFEELEEELAHHDLALRIDADRRQVLLFRSRTDAASPVTITGYIVCAETGARLPFATVSWREEGRLLGSVANESGVFQLRFPPDAEEGDARQVTASYVGYEPKDVTLGPQAPGEVTIRLEPDHPSGPEVVVQSHLLDTELDTTWHNLIEPNLAAPFGEPSVLRALQPLPAVALSGAFNDGLVVRGSRPDGFQVLLDGATIYNYSHFFGLFDVFNEEALQTVGFYYGIAPASMQAPPGGTLSFITRPGSQTRYRQHVAVSNAAVQATMEGPFADGRGSWLVSGRHSYLDTFDWFNNRQIIAHGLGIEQFSSLPDFEEFDPSNRVLLSGDSEARFYDVHGKLQYEWDSGRRLMANVYSGGDFTSQEALRLFFGDDDEPGFVFDADTSLDIPRQSVDTHKRWGNAAASLHLQQPLQGGRHAHTILAASRYVSDFAKDDFVYTRTAPGSNETSYFVGGFESYNELLDLKVEQRYDAPLARIGTWSAGVSANHYRVDYQERTAVRPRYVQHPRSTLLDVYAQMELTRLRHLDLRAGVRSHYFSNGGFLRLSPRIDLRLFPEQLASLGLGYSNNHQFLHRLALEHSNTPNVWVMSSQEEPPARVHHGTAGIYLRPSRTTFAQVEGYVKSYQHLRQHEAVVESSDFLRAASERLEPWLHDNRAYARGVEVMVRQRFGPVLSTTSYALSKVDLVNDRAGSGDRFPATWDRRHQFQTKLQGSFGAGWSAHLSWLLTSGAPNNLAFTNPDEPERLPPYHRMDLTLQWQPSIGGVDLEARMGLFNLYNRHNTVHRTPVSVLDPDTSDPALSFMNVDVYDLGFQPSFELAVSF